MPRCANSPKASMPEPTVCAVMLTRDRPELAKRAVECFRAQTYPNKRLMIFNTGHNGPLISDAEALDVGSQIHEPCVIGAFESIGELRNEAISATEEMGAEIVIHWDDDDWSHPNRITEQAALLQSSGADCVGYREMLFWRDGRELIPHGLDSLNGCAYLYSNPDPTYCLGTSLCYWRKTWERNPFSERNGPNPRTRGEDREFLRGINSAGQTSLPLEFCGSKIPGSQQWLKNPCAEHEVHQQVPRMIARIHAGNAQHYQEAWSGTSHSWRRAAEWDERCHEIMEAR